MGQTVRVLFGGVEGTLTLPSLPEWGEHEKDPLHKPLLGPAAARTWKRGETPIYWGSPTSYPTGTATVDLALLEFSSEPENYDNAAQKIYETFGPWLKLFEDYVKLLTKQRTSNTISGGDGLGHLELLFDDGSRLKHISRRTPTTISIEMSSKDESLHLEQFSEAAQTASKGLLPRLHYRMLLEAYTARRNEDYRKAIIEAATALEACLTVRILEEFNAQGISFGEKLLQKFRMLGGRFELIRLLDISLPEKDYSTLIVNPRNDVIHRASFPDKKLANKIIAEVEELLNLFSPQLYENV
ncbi:MAG: hypothetical protein FJ123_11150 [Deltaproteobacteria bacterium]|nr:hypothetical protein [Deltaproteobacteria bacterium]